MKCTICGAETDLMTENGSPICNYCAKERGFDICTETGKYKDFVCSNICGDCERKKQ